MAISGMNKLSLKLCINRIRYETVSNQKQDRSESDWTLVTSILLCLFHLSLARGNSFHRFWSRPIDVGIIANDNTHSRCDNFHMSAVWEMCAEFHRIVLFYISFISHLVADARL